MARSEPADIGIARELLFYGREGIETVDRRRSREFE